MSDMPPAGAIEAVGVRFPVVRAGEGTPVLFLHGAWADYRAWSGLWRDIAAQHQFLAYTARHFGTAGWPSDRPYSADVHSADLVAILDRLGTPVHLAGWSYAGRILLAAARSRPALVRSIAIYEPSLASMLDIDAESRAIRDAYWQGLAPIYELARAGDLDRAMRLGIEYVFGQQPGGFSALAPAFRDMFLQNAHTMLPDLDAPPPSLVGCDELRAVRCPVLLVVGQDTWPVFARTAQLILDCLPDGRRIMLPRIGHGAPVEVPEQFATAVLGFLADVETARG